MKKIKLCKNCKYFEEEFHLGSHIHQYTCVHDRAKNIQQNYVTGGTTTRFEECAKMRLSSGWCQPEGLLFERNEKWTMKP